MLETIAEILWRLHRDQRGAFSPTSVFGIFLFRLLLGQITNLGQRVDGKLLMQNAAANSGGLSI